MPAFAEMHHAAMIFEDGDRMQEGMQMPSNQNELSSMARGMLSAYKLLLTELNIDESISAS